MSEKQFNGRIVHKNDIADNWTKATGFIPKQGEIIVYNIDDTYDYERIKIGDGVTNVNSLPFANEVANTANTLSTARTLTVGNTGKIFDGSKNVSWSLSEIGATVSNSISNGTTTGPALTTTVNGVTGSAVTIPAATSGISGVVTTGSQNFNGVKTFLSSPRVSYNSTSPMIYLLNSSYSYGSCIYYNIPENSTTSRLCFRTYSRSSSTYGTNSYYETYNLPSTDADRTSTASYSILTSKSPVTIAQGGTNATTTTGIVSNIKSALIDTIYPIGSIYITMNETSPTTLFGGTWERIEGSFLLGAHANASNGDGYALGEYGGEATHILTTSEMPSHYHPTYNGSGWANFEVHRDGTVSRTQVATSSSSGKYTFTATTSSDIQWPYNQTGVQGEGVAHNNMPPYLAVYIWKRTA